MTCTFSFSRELGHSVLVVSLPARQLGTHARSFKERAAVFLWLSGPRYPSGRDGYLGRGLAVLAAIVSLV